MITPATRKGKEGKEREKNSNLVLLKLLRVKEIHLVLSNRVVTSSEGQATKGLLKENGLRTWKKKKRGREEKEKRERKEGRSR